LCRAPGPALQHPRAQKTPHNQCWLPSVRVAPKWDWGTETSGPEPSSFKGSCRKLPVFERERKRERGREREREREREVAGVPFHAVASPENAPPWSGRGVPRPGCNPSPPPAPVGNTVGSQGVSYGQRNGKFLTFESGHMSPRHNWQASGSGRSFGLILFIARTGTAGMG
jgi:hypothetical protein